MSESVTAAQLAALQAASASLTANASALASDAAALSAPTNGTAPQIATVQTDAGTVTSDASALASAVAAVSLPTITVAEFEALVMQSGTITAEAMQLALDVAALTPGSGGTPTAATVASQANPTANWIQLAAAFPALAVTLTGGSSAYAQLFLFGVAEGSVHAFTPGTLPSLTPAHVGTYTVRIFADSGAATQIGESCPVQVWASASGPASAALTMNALPSITQGQNFTISGTAITANNFVIVNVQEGGTAFPFMAAVSGGTWSLTMAVHQTGINSFTVSDPTSGTSATQTFTGTVAAATAPTIVFVGLSWIAAVAILPAERLHVAVRLCAAVHRRSARPTPADRSSSPAPAAFRSRLAIRPTSTRAAISRRATTRSPGPFPQAVSPT